MSFRPASILAAIACSASLSGCHGAPRQTVVAFVAAAPGSGYEPMSDEVKRGLDACIERPRVVGSMMQAKTSDDYEPDFVLLATQNANAVFGVGHPAIDGMTRAASRFEAIHFVAIDAFVNSPNVESITFDMRGGSVRAGRLAALASHRRHVAFLGGISDAVTADYASGFRSGVASAGNGTIASTSYAGSFTDGAAAERAVQQLASAGVDVVYLAAGRADRDAIAAAKRAGIAVIAADTDLNDLAPTTVIASVVKDVFAAAHRACIETVAQKPGSGHVIRPAVLRTAPNLDARLGTSAAARWHALERADPVEETP